MSFDEGKHPRVPAGSPKGGEFTSSGGYSLGGSFVPGVSGVQTPRWDKERMDRKLREVTKDHFGKEFGLDDTLKLCGVLPGATVHEFELEDTGVINLSWTLPAKGGGDPIAGGSRSLFLTTKTIYNNSFHVNPEHQGKGIGAKMLNQEVQAGARLGFVAIETFGAGEKGSRSNGYYTWPRLGFLPRGSRLTKAGAGKVSIEYLSQGHMKPAVIDMARMMSTKRGRDWWKENGSAQSLAFDLRQGSVSRRVLGALVKERGLE